jgi:hypothetical protein
MVEFNISATAPSGTNLSSAGTSATNLSGSHRPTSASQQPTTSLLRHQVEYFADEMVLGELEKHEVLGLPITRRMSLSIVCCAFIALIALGIGLGHMLAEEENFSSLSDDKRFEALFDMLEPLTGPDIGEVGTPEYRALMWMAVEDPAKMSPRSHIDELVQRFVLTTIYEATQGDKWVDAYHFKSYMDVCRWNKGDDENGVYCTDGMVTHLELDDLNLNGTIPIDIGLLTHLEHLNIHGNYLRQHMPSSIGMLHKLTNLDMRTFLRILKIALRAK